MATQADVNPSQATRLPLVGVSIRSGWKAQGAAIGLIASMALATWLWSGVSPADAARYAAFQALFVLLPGCLLYLLLSPRHQGWLRTLAIGWPLGVAIEIGAFALTAALDERWLLQLLPVIAALTLGPALAARRRVAREDPHALAAARLDPVARRAGVKQLVALCLGVCLVLALLALRFFAHYPLPEHTRSVAYLPDNVFTISLAAEARHHWPITEPYVAGQALHFYPGVFIHVAAIGQVTGVAAATVVLRLLPTTLILIIALQLWTLCGELGESPWLGVVAIVLFFLVGELSLDATRFETFGLNFFNMLSEAPTNTLGMAFFLALLMVVQRQIRDTSARYAQTSCVLSASGAGSVALVGALAAGGATVKTMLAAVFVGGLVLLLLVHRSMLAGTRRLLSAYAAVSLACVAAIYLTTLAGGLSPFRVEPFGYVRYSVFAPLFPAHSPLRFALLACAGVLAASFLCVPLVGALWLLRRPRNEPFVALCAAMFVASLGAYVLLAGPGDNEIDFLTYGYLAVVPIAALGLTRLWREMPARVRGCLVRTCPAMLALGLAVAGATQILTDAGILTRAELISGMEALWGPKRLAWALCYIAVYGLAMGATLVIALRIGRRLTPASYTRAARIAACSIPMVVALGLVKTVGVAAPELLKTVEHRRVAVADSGEDQGMNAALYSGLRWVRSHTPSCAVLAVSNHYLKTGDRDPRYFYYSAFAERRVYLESWAYPAHWSRPQPFPGRLALNEAATSAGSPAAVRALERSGVSYILIDKSHGGRAREPASLAALVFSNAALDVYGLRGQVASERTC
jgi:hypothetical protein